MLIENQVHLGDYIYEGAAQGERAHSPPRLLFSLYDYRTRHGQVRLSCQQGRVKTLTIDR